MFKSKQVLVIRKDLNMRKGKIAAQAAHASMKVLLDCMQKHITAIAINGTASVIKRSIEYDSTSMWYDWLEGSFAKITVCVNSEEELHAIHKAALLAGLPTAIIQDSGRTEFNGVPTYTAVAVGPDWVEKIDPITGHLTLL